MPADTFQIQRFIGASTFVTGTWVGGTSALSKVWYADFKKSNFHTFDDARDWMQMDKIGHLYTGAKLAELHYSLYKWTGLSEKKSAYLGASLSLGYLTTLEILDGYNADWGFSWSDMAANVLGSGLFLSQEMLWQKQRFVLKFSSHLTEYAAYRPEVLGKSRVERLLKDYNGQTYWLTTSPKHFTSKWPLPSWLCFSLGYSVDQKLVGSTNYFISNQSIFQAKRQFLFSFDIDIDELPIKNKWVKRALSPLRYIKIPFPTLILSNSTIQGKWLYF